MDREKSIVMVITKINNADHRVRRMHIRDKSVLSCGFVSIYSDERLGHSCGFVCSRKCSYIIFL